MPYYFISITSILPSGVWIISGQALVSITAADKAPPLALVCIFHRKLRKGFAESNRIGHNYQPSVETRRIHGRLPAPIPQVTTDLFGSVIVTGVNLPKQCRTRSAGCFGRAGRGEGSLKPPQFLKTSFWVNQCRAPSPHRF